MRRAISQGCYKKMGSKQLYVLGHNMGTNNDENSIKPIMESRKTWQQ